MGPAIGERGLAMEGMVDDIVELGGGCPAR